MEEQKQASEISSREASPPRLFTLGEAAGCLAVREDDLRALLPDTVVATEVRLVLGLTDTDVAALESFIRDIRRFSAESVYGGGDL
jgi:hypothetical protein